MQHQRFTLPLMGSWAQYMICSAACQHAACMCAGPLPASWATPGALQSLSTLVLSANNLSGSLPPEWGANGTSFVKLAKLDVRQNGLGGYLPDLWGPGFKVLADRQCLLYTGIPKDSALSIAPEFRTVLPVGLRMLCSKVP